MTWILFGSLIFSIFQRNNFGNKEEKHYFCKWEKRSFDWCRTLQNREARWFLSRYLSSWQSLQVSCFQWVRRNAMSCGVHKYQLIYRMFGGDSEKAPNIEIPEIRLPMISLLKKQLSQLKDILYHVDDYMIQRNIYGNYSVNIPASLCCCCGVERTDIKLLSESEDWIRIAAI